MSNGDGGQSIEKDITNDGSSMLRGPGTRVGTGNGIISSFCSADKPQCVHVEYSDDGSGYPIVVTDTKTEGDPAFLRFSVDEWDAFTAGVEAGEFNTERLQREKGGLVAEVPPASVEPSADVSVNEEARAEAHSW